jgi:hypothetical protein
MSDHVDGPRSIGDPAADLTDLFAFTNPENPQRTRRPNARCGFAGSEFCVSEPPVLDTLTTRAAGRPTAARTRPGTMRAIGARRNSGGLFTSVPKHFQPCAKSAVVSGHFERCDDSKNRRLRQWLPM